MGEKRKAEFLEIEMQYSVVDKSRLQENLRIDAEFYSPYYLSLAERLNSRKTGLLRDYIYFAKKGIFDLSPDLYVTHGIPLIRTSEIKDPLIDFSSTVFLEEKTHETNRKTELNPSDIVFTKIGAYIGDVAVLPPKYGKYNFSQNVIGAKVRKDKIKPGFLLAFLLSKYGNRQIKRIIMLSGQGKLELEDIKNIKIVVFDEKIKSLIHNLVMEAETLKENSVNLHEEAEQILLSELGLLDWKPKRRLSFVKNFSDTKSVDRIDADYFQPMYDELIERVKQYGNGYEKLDNLISIKKCIEPGSEAYQENGIPFLRVSNLSKFGINSDNQRYISESLYQELKNYQPQKGEILLSKDATPGIAFYLNNEPEKMIPSGGILRLKVGDVMVIYPEYLTLALNSVVVQMQIERDIGGSVINHWLVDQVKNALIPILPKSIQKDISDKIADSFLKREQSKKLLDIAKRAVELAIEQNEEEAGKWLNDEVNNAGSSVHLESR